MQAAASDEEQVVGGHGRRHLVGVDETADFLRAKTSTDTWRLTLTGTPVGTAGRRRVLQRRTPQREQVLALEIPLGALAGHGGHVLGAIERPEFPEKERSEFTEPACAG